MADKIENQEIKINFKAKGSKSTPYNVCFVIQNNRLFANCDCKAGRFRQLCKHKIDIIAGDESRLFNCDEKEKLNHLKNVFLKYPDLKRLTSRAIRLKGAIQQEEYIVEVAIRRKLTNQLKEGVTIYRKNI
ncbi:MAG: hypothetical protein KAS96_08890 [Planctomycetes bacterium]|nr:hypothetical protein [Planctomycetota bacterium]